MRIANKPPPTTESKPKTEIKQQKAAPQKETPPETEASKAKDSGGVLDRLQTSFDKATEFAGELIGQPLQELTDQVSEFQSSPQLAQELHSQLQSAMLPSSPGQEARPSLEPPSERIFQPKSIAPGRRRPAPKNKEGGFGKPASGDSVGARFHDYGGAAEKSVMRERVNLNGDKHSRMQALHNFTQYDTKVSEESDTNACAAACVVSGAVIQGGQQGLQNLVKVIEDRENSTVRKMQTSDGWKSEGIAEWSKLPGIKERISSGTVTKQDLADLKTIVYKQLRKVEHDKDLNHTNKTIDIDAVKAYIQTDVKGGFLERGEEHPLKGMFDKMNIKLVDTTGNNSGNHFVLFFNDGNGTNENSLYDPWPQKEGSQITQNPNEMLPYHQNVKNAVR
jgi:hypothetical protein